MRIHFLVHVRTWLRRKRQDYSRRISDTIENVLTSDGLFNTMAKWKSRVLYIQRTMKLTIQNNEAKYSRLLSLWDKAEIRAYGEFNNTVKHNKELTGKTTGGATSIPESIKILYMRTYLRQARHKHSRKWADYKKELEKLRMPEQSQEGLNSLSDVVPPDRPAPLTLCCTFSEETLMSLIRKCERERADWAHQLRIESTRIRLN